MKRFIITILLFLSIITFAVASPSKEKDTAQPATIRVGIPKAPPALPILRMIDQNVLGDTTKIEFTVWDAPEQLIAMIQGGEHDMFAFPLTVVAKLYNKGLPVTLTNVNTWGVTYFLTTDPDFKDWSQLKGKTVYIPLKSSPPDAITNFFMAKAGLTPGKDVNIVYVNTPEVTQLLASGKAQYATQIEPQVTAAMMQNKDVRIAYAFENEWKKFTSEDTIIPNAGFGAKMPFINANKELVATFETEYEKALDWVINNPTEAGILAEKYIGLKAGLVTNAIPRMGLMYKNSFDAKADLTQFYTLLNDYDKSIIGGKLPDEKMLYRK